MSEKRLGILWYSNAAHAPTGYGNQTRLFTKRLVEAGHTVVVFPFYGREAGAARNQDGILELPRLVHDYGQDWIQDHYLYCKTRYPEVDWIVFSLIDPFALNPEVMTNFPWSAWVPVDSEPMKPGNVAALRGSRWQVAMSRFGERMLKMAGFNPLYCPHGIDAGTFKPDDRQAARQRLSQMTGTDLDGKFLVVDVAANKGTPSRKNFVGLLETFVQFAGKHDDALLYLHTEVTGVMGGENILWMLQNCYPDIKDKVVFAPQYSYLMASLDAGYLNDVYNAADVFFHPSMAEGFGIPIIEAQLAGCPVIVTDGSAMSELCFTDWKVPAIPIPYSAQPPSKYRYPLPPELLKALEGAYQRRGDETLRQQVHKQAQAYHVDTVLEKYMLPALTSIYDDLQADKKKKQAAKRTSDSRKRRNGQRSAAMRKSVKAALKKHNPEPDGTFIPVPPTRFWGDE